MRELMVRDAIREALDEEMARDNTVFQMGEDIGVIGGNFKCTVGLRDKYGDLRVKDTPISEQGFVGMGVGAALTGLRPVVELMFADFMMVCGDQLFNQMAKITYMSGGQCNVPMVVRLPLGGGRSSAAQHSQSIHAWAAHIPGVKVVVPSTAGECKGLLKTPSGTTTPLCSLSTRCSIPPSSTMSRRWRRMCASPSAGPASSRRAPISPWSPTP